MNHFQCILIGRTLYKIVNFVYYGKTRMPLLENRDEILAQLIYPKTELVCINQSYKCKDFISVCIDDRKKQLRRIYEFVNKIKTEDGFGVKRSIHLRLIFFIAFVPNMLNWAIWSCPLLPLLWSKPQVSSKTPYVQKEIIVFFARLETWESLC